MSTSNSIRRAVRYALMTGAIASAAAAVPAFAADENISEVVVTGSRIRIKDFEAISPVATVSAEAIQSTGNLNVEKVLNTLPQVVPGFSSTSNNPADGTATVDLRGLGAIRTLVLINGRRLNPSVNDGTVDLNNVPTRLIERVEVVTGGASAVYGSDALAGVVNFILKDNFEGFDIGVQTGQSAKGDGRENQVDMLLGGNFADDKGNITAFAGYYERDEILQSERSYTRVDRSGGSGTGNARLPNAALNPFPDYDTFLGSGGDGNQYAFALDGSTTVRPWNNTLPETSDDGQGDRYNFAPVNFLLTPAQRINLGVMGHYNLSDNITAYTELLYVDSQNANQLAPTPAVNVQFDPLTPLISQQARDLLAARPDATAPGLLTRRMIEVGARLQENKSKLSQLTVGVRGDLGIMDWQYDAYYSYGRTDFRNVTTNDVSKSRLSAGLSNCPADYIKYVPNCVAVDAFGVGAITEEAADFIRLNFTDTLLFERNMASASINGSIMDLPAGSWGFAAGVEYREDSSDYTPDLAKEQGDILGFNAQQPISGKFDVSEVYVESVVPLLRDLPAVNSLSLEVGARFSDYSSVGNVAAYKAGLDWSPIDVMHVRGMYQRANRAPSVFELFKAGDQGYPAATDPCASIAPDGDVNTVAPDIAAFCQSAFGIDSSTFAQTNAQLQSFFYGNPNLKEETSDTVTFGVAVQPSSVPSLQFSVDYWTIKVEDYINDLAGGASGIIAACFATLDLESAACNSSTGMPLLFRDEVGDLRVNVPTANVSELKTSGIDFQINYGIPMAWTGFAAGSDTLKMNLLVTWLDEYVLDDIDYAGTIGGYNLLSAFPEYKANLRLTYGIGPVDLTWNIQYIDKMDNQGNIPEFEDGGYVGVGSVVYHDIGATWNISDSYQVSAGVRNLGDKIPPYFDVPIDQNTDPSTYDMLGRYYFASARAKF